MKLSSEKEVQDKLKSFGLIPSGLGPDDYKKFMDAEAARWGAVIKAQNIKVE